MKVIILSITIIVSSIFVGLHGKDSQPFFADGLGYYLYLPATLIYDNFDSVYQFPANADIPSFVQKNMAAREKESLRPEGKPMIQYTYGVALMELPFFIMAHAYEKIAGLPANGYSATYQFFIRISTFFYALVGMLLVYRLLKRFVSETHALLAVALLFLGSNLFWFSLHQSGMAHVPLFCLYALLMYLTVKVHEKPLAIIFMCMAFCIGLITLIRPTDITCILIPLLYNVYNYQTFKEKLTFIKRNFLKIAFAGIFFIVPFIPQFIYWKYITGYTVYYSYGEQGFNWSNPMIFAGLFSASNGWLYYSPLMAFSVIGLLFYKSIKQWAWCLWLIFPLYIYIVYSWYCYNYINGLGSRPMVNIYPLLAVGLAAFVQFMSRQKLIFKSVFFIVCVFFIALNVSYSMQQARSLLNSEESNYAFNTQIMFKMNLNYNDLVVKDVAERQPDTSALKSPIVLGFESYDDSASANYVRDSLKENGFVYRMGDEEYNARQINAYYDTKKLSGAKWFKGSGKFMITEQPYYYQHLFVLLVQHEEDVLLWKGCKVDNKISPLNSNGEDISLFSFETDQWATVYFFVRIPDEIRQGDEIKLFIWNIGRTPLYLDDIKLEAF